MLNTVAGIRAEVEKPVHFPMSVSWGQRKRATVMIPCAINAATKHQKHRLQGGEFGDFQGTPLFQKFQKFPKFSSWRWMCFCRGR
jgi:hypothetical protein